MIEMCDKNILEYMAFFICELRHYINYYFILRCGLADWW